MGGGLMQLIAYGAQDMYLTGNPQITFFKVVYRRHTNFAMEAISQSFEGDVNSGCQVSCTIARNGDLVHRVYLEVQTHQDDDPLQNVFALVNRVDLEIGGQLIDRHYGKWMAMWCELTHSTSKHEQLQKLMSVDAGKCAWLPFQFSFCRNPGLSIPLIALQYHEIKLNIKFNEIPEKWSLCLWCDYIYLDTDERRRFAQTSHEYLIEQTQTALGNCVQTDCETNVPLHLNHPVKELLWVIPDDTKWGWDSNVKWTQELSGKVMLRLNGQERFSARDESYFRDVQRYQHHTGADAVPYSSAVPNDIYLYSFAIDPEDHQPSGTCNFSRIDNSKLVVDATALGTGNKLDVYAVNYNVFRIMSGMGGLAYSN